MQNLLKTEKIDFIEYKTESHDTEILRRIILIELLQLSRVADGKEQSHVFLYPRLALYWRNGV